MPDGHDQLEAVLEFTRRATPGQVEAVCRSLETSGSAAIDASVENALAALPGGELRDLLQRKLLRFGVLDPRTEAAALASALRAASAMDQLWLRNQSLNVVWTGPAPPGGTFRRTEQALLEVISSSLVELWLVSFAGYRLPAVRDALLNAARRGVTVHFVNESPEESEGRVTFSALEGLGRELAESSRVYVWPLARRPKDERGRHGSLHAKCALADRILLFVSSANLTEFAMNLNMELGLLVRGGDAPARVADHFGWLVEQRYLKLVR